MYLWEDHGSFSNLYHTSQLFVYSPIVFLDLIGRVIQLKQTFFVYFVTLSTLSAFSFLRLLEYLYIQNNEKNMQRNYQCGIYFLLITGSLLYILSPFIVEELSHPTVKYAFYLTPLFLIFMFRGFNENKMHFMIALALIWTFMCGALQHVVYGAVVLTLYFIFQLILIFRADKTNKLSNLLSKAKLYMVAILLFILINTFWLIPVQLAGSVALYPKVLSVESIAYTFRYANLINIFSFKGNFGLVDSYGDIPKYFPSFLQTFNLNVFLIIFSVLSISYLLVNRKTAVNKNILFLTLLLVVVIIMSVWPALSSDFISYIFFKIPFSSTIIWAFRTPKFNQYIPVIIFTLFTGTLLSLYTRLHRKYQYKDNKLLMLFPIAVLVCSIVFALIPNYPLLTGDFNGRLQPTKLPEDYDSMISFFDEQPGANESKIIWVNMYNGQKSEWSNFGIGDFETDLSVVPSFTNIKFYTQFEYPLLSGLPYNIESMLQANRINNLAKFYRPMGINYLIIHKDISSIKSEQTDLIRRLIENKQISLAYHKGFVYIFRVDDPTPQIDIKNSQISIINRGLEDYNSLSSIDTFGSEDGIVYNNRYDVIDDISSTIIFNDKFMIKTPNEIALNPFISCIHYKPDLMWSKEYADSVSFRNWLDYENIPGFLQFDTGDGLIFTTAKGTVETVPFRVIYSGEYRVFARTLNSKSGGTVELYTENSALQAITKDAVSGFKWTKFGNINLTEGNHELFVKNVDGFNAINTIILVPIDEYSNTLDATRLHLKNKHIVNIFEAERDLYVENTDIYENSNYSNGRGVFLTGQSRARQKLDILNSGYYEFSLTGEGEFVLTIINNTYNISRENFGRAYSQPIYLKEGTREFELKQNPESKENQSTLDTVWVYTLNSTNLNDTIEDLLYNPDSPGKVLSYSKINPTFWKAHIYAKNPFLLTFTEYFDKFWEARLYRDGKFVKTIEPIKMYGVINGFQIDETGNLDIEIRYKPQDWFEGGLAVSAVIFVGCVIYLLYYQYKKKKTSQKFIRQPL